MLVDAEAVEAFRTTRSLPCSASLLLNRTVHSVLVSLTSSLGIKPRTVVGDSTGVVETGGSCRAGLGGMALKLVKPL